MFEPFLRENAYTADNNGALLLTTRGTLHTRARFARKLYDRPEAFASKMPCAQRARVTPRRPRGHDGRMFTAVKLLVTSGAYKDLVPITVVRLRRRITLCRNGYLQRVDSYEGAVRGKKMRKI